jgi:hypothetical protein
MPGINHRPAGELGKKPIRTNQFFFVYQSVMGIVSFWFFYQTTRKIRAASTTFKNKRDKHSPIRLKKRISREKSESINKLPASLLRQPINDINTKKNCDNYLTDFPK